MTRPIYETPDDTANEKAVADTVARVWGGVAVSNGQKHSVDFLFNAFNGTRAWLEVKCRNNEYGKYPTLAISLHKMMMGTFYAMQTGLPFYLIVRYTDGIWGCLVSNLSQYFIEIGGGRKDRGDRQDTELMLHISTKDFFRII